MAARKLAQEVDKCFKKVAEGVAEFEAIYDKIEQSNNQAQKEKLEDNLKREIKKLQRLRDQIKTWAASNDIKDKTPLLEHRRLIETQMEKFKAVEKAMKTKAYSKEGLSASAKLDPKEQAKVEASEFLASMVEELELQIEALEAEGEAIQATMKKGKGHGAKADRMAEIEGIIDRHKWHQGKLELIRRSLDNGGLEPEQVTDLEESIRYYVSDGMTEDFIEDDGLYDELNLQEEEDVYGMNLDNEKGSSQDTQSIQEDPTDTETRPGGSISGGKARSVAEPPPPASTAAAASGGRRPSTQMKSPLPSLATVHNPLPIISNGAQSSLPMKPASVPTRPAGEGLKYASAAAAAAASDKNNVGIAPLPPPPSLAGPLGAAISALPPTRQSTASSPSTIPVQLVSQISSQQQQQQQQQQQPPPDRSASTSVSSPACAPLNVAPAPGLSSRTEVTRAGPSRARTAAPLSNAPETPSQRHQERQSPAPTNETTATRTNGAAANGVKAAATAPTEVEKEEESIYHLPSSLQDLVDSFEMTKKRPAPINTPLTLRMHAASQATAPDISDIEAPRVYQPDVRFQSTSQFPQEPLSIFDDPRLYSRIDPDTLFYVFYYKQGTYQQYLAAKALKDQSWRFHKQYQTWFQRHEEPKAITEEFEQGTYRFFDYESTWMNRRKADFKFAYKFLEDDV